MPAKSRSPVLCLLGVLPMPIHTKQTAMTWLTSCSPSSQSSRSTLTGPCRHQDRGDGVYSVAHNSFHCWLCAGLKVLIYSGDHDMCVPHTGSEAWTSSLGLKVKEAWRPWKVDHQVPTLLCIMCNQKRDKAKCRLSNRQVHATQVNSLQKGLFSASGEAIQCMLHGCAPAFGVQQTWNLWRF